MTDVKKVPSYRRTGEREVRYVLQDDRALEKDQQPVWVLIKPTVRELAAAQDATDGENQRVFEYLVRFIDRLENHPDASAFGKPGSDERRTYIDMMDMAVVQELKLELIKLCFVSEDERKNSSAPSVSAPTTDGASAAVASRQI